MKRFQKWALVLGVSLAFFWGGMAEAFEPYYLNGDKTYPMIQNTGGIYNDGATGLFLDLSTLTVEDVFEDGLQTKVKIVDVKSAQTYTESWIHVRYSVDGKAWALGQGGRWREIPSNTEDPAALTVYFIAIAIGARAGAEWALNNQTYTNMNSWFHYAKLYAATAGCIGFMMRKYKWSIGKTEWFKVFPFAIVAINYLIAAASDIESGIRGAMALKEFGDRWWLSSESVWLYGGWWNWVNGIAGIVKIFCMTAWRGIYSPQD